MDQALAIIREYILEYAAVPPAVGDVEMETVFDEAKGHYQLSMQGWIHQRRIHAMVIQVDVRGDKIYIQHDGTEEGLSSRLLEAGFPANRIVLCWQSPQTRAHTKFAVA